MAKRTAPPTSLQFFSKLKWLDGRPLLDTIEPYRRKLFTAALDSYGRDGVPIYNMVLSGRAKKNNKTTDLVLASLYCTVVRRRSMQGNDAIILASDEDQAADDLSLCRKLVEFNPDLHVEFEKILAKELRLRDGSGSIRILPARDIAGLHGKQAGFIGYDEIHTQRDWALMEALQPDPTRPDALQWITSYDTIYNTPGVPLFDLKQIGQSGTDAKMLFSWYSGDVCTDPDFAELEPELRANPSIASWPEGRAYLAQQRRRLPTHKFRRLHLNLPGAPTNAFLDQGKFLEAIMTGRRSLPYEEGKQYRAFVDISGGSNDDAVLAIGHQEDCNKIVDLVVAQAGRPPFNPLDAVRRFVKFLDEYHVYVVWGDNYAGNTFAAAFEAAGRSYQQPPRATELYESFEPALNAGEVKVPDIVKLQEQALCLVQKGSKIEGEGNTHDDYINAVAGLVWLLRNKAPMQFTQEMVNKVYAMPRHSPMPRGCDGGGRGGGNPFALGERAAAQMRRRRGF